MIILTGFMINDTAPRWLQGNFTGTLTDGRPAFGEYLTDWEAAQFLAIHDAVVFSNLVLSGELAGTYTIIQDIQVFGKAQLSAWMDNRIAAGVADEVRAQQPETPIIFGETPQPTVPPGMQGIPMALDPGELPHYVDVVNMRVTRIINNESTVEWDENIQISAFPFFLRRDGEGAADFLVELSHPITGEIYRSHTYHINFGG